MLNLSHSHLKQLLKILAYYIYKDGNKKIQQEVTFGFLCSVLEDCHNHHLEEKGEQAKSTLFLDPPEN